MKTGKKVALTAIVAGVLAIGGIKYSERINQYNGWNSSLVSQMESTLQIPHELVREAEMYSTNGFGSLAPVYATENNGITRVNFEFTDGNGQATAFYKDQKMIQAVYSDKKGNTLAFKRNVEGKVVYVSDYSLWGKLD